MRRLIVTSVLLSAMVMMSHFALAHTDEYLATVKAPHGGQLRVAGPFHLELVAKDGELTLYITDHGDKPVSTSGGQGKANIQVGKDGERKSVTLEPVYANIMKGKGDFQITPETSVAVFIAIPEHETQGAQFMPQAPKGEKEDQDHHHHHHHHHHDHGDGDAAGSDHE
ncbi:hypothetical protein [Nitrosomonas sp. Nm58]|uniref:hypothetical protein n=1 Tax=Nitrosomonas sp. Nm58 TaxID=200126 RepID=UPI0008985F7E|nr:hypothetical protein [Nitrosomonas sp. Nm58]SDZ13253.1 hypothetical protein SAMN05421754_10684 [Nitrosomonas sp. Nm58]